MDAVLRTPGATPQSLRRAALARAAALGGAAREPSPEVPSEIVAFIDKVAQESYKVTDADIQRLKDAGYPEEAIYEITVSAALGAAMARLERGLSTLKGGS